MSGQLNHGAILWAGLRQVQAMRESVCWSIGGRALPHDDESSVAAWLAQQGLDEPQGRLNAACQPRAVLLGDTVANEQLPEHREDAAGGAARVDSQRSPVLLIDSAVEDRRSRLLGEDWAAATFLGKRATGGDLDDFGARRSGAGWQDAAIFCITSAFVRLLGELEQFELDALKALFNYRARGGELLGHAMDQELEVAELSVILEEPIEKDQIHTYRHPAVWTWIRPHAEIRVQRETIFSRVFGINPTPKEYRKKRRIWYDKRNQIAHGRGRVEMALSEYVDVDVFATESILHLACECREKQKLIISSLQGPVC